MDVLENTLWNRQLGVMSEEIVAALVCQIFEGAACAWHPQYVQSVLPHHQTQAASCQMTSACSPTLLGKCRAILL